MSSTPTTDTENTTDPTTADAAAPEGALSKAYDPVEVEQRWQETWESAGIFVADVEKVRSGAKKPYVIMMPPPNVTGTLHNGHALFVTLQDILTRYHRMQGFEALWLPGVDHAGIATQAVVERELIRHEGTSRHDLGREKFLERVWQWKDKHGSRIVEQLKVMGASADWSRERFTMDDMCSGAVREAFVRMWNDGLIYRGERLVNWDPASHTALSNEEVDHEEKDGELYRFAYKVKGSDDEIVVATTRPETMLGDVAVAVHPEDERYTHLKGKHLAHPFFADRDVVVITDTYVDKEFGTGAVKITPAHDPNDFEMGQRHALPMINIFTLTGAINDAGGPFTGLDRFAARSAVKAKLDELGLFRGTENIKHNVSISQRSGVAIEPMLSRQYFVKGAPLAALAMAAVNSGETRILPESWKSTWDHFMTNIRDWCISRQLWWGHRIPVFYDLEKMQAAVRAHGGEAQALLDAGKPNADVLAVALTALPDDVVRSFSIASVDDLATREPSKYVQEEDVLDTWFSSGLWPFSTLGWPEKTRDLDAFYPGAVLETGFDILFFWVARMMMMGTYFMGKAPFKDVFLHAMVRDAQGRKMSKSLGNAIDPIDVIRGISKDDLLAKTKTYPVPEKMLPQVLKGIEKEYPEGIPQSGADGLRFSLAALSGQGRDVKLAIPRVSGYRAFLNKVWNATRFALMRIGDDPVSSVDDVKRDLSLPDRWILSRQQVVVEKTARAIENYRFDEAANAIYQFFWTEFCDWYVELAKTSLRDDATPEKRRATIATLVHVLDSSMRLIHPLAPFQSEEIWQKLPGRDTRWPDVKFCAIAPYPKKDMSLVDEEAERHVDAMMRAVSMMRNARQESGLSPQTKVPATVLVEDAGIRASLVSLAAEMRRLSSTETIDVRSKEGFEAPRLSAMNADRGIEIVIPLAGLIDVEAEKVRLAKEIEKSKKERDGIQKRIDSPGFTEKAPPEVVDEAKANVASITARVGRFEAALERLKRPG
jgi:valyl-tRNA synthetase